MHVGTVGSKWNWFQESKSGFGLKRCMLAGTRKTNSVNYTYGIQVRMHSYQDLIVNLKCQNSNHIS